MLLLVFLVALAMLAGWAIGAPAFEFVVLWVIALLLFGKRLSAVLRSVSRGVQEFYRAQS